MKKRYKLKKWYPSLPSDWKEGMIVGMGDKNWEYSPESSIYSDCLTILNNEVENNPEFWEEVKEKEYNILEFSDGINKYYKRENDNFTINLQYDYYEEDLLKQNDKKITKIKRLSDGEIFTIGDKIYETITDKKEHWNIKEFSIEDSRCFTSGVNINNIEKAKQPLFVTEDDVEIFEGDKCYIVGNNWNWIEQIAFTNEYGNNKTTYKQVWATKEAAEKWIDNNKPIYSKKQINEALDKCTTVRAMSRNEFEHILGI